MSKKHNCHSCENLNHDASCAVLQQNARPTTPEDRQAVLRWQSMVPWARVDDKHLRAIPTVESSGCPGYVSDDPADYPDASPEFHPCPICSSLIGPGPTELDALRAQVAELQEIVRVANGEAMEERAAVVALLRREVPNRDTGLTFPPSRIIRTTLDGAAAVIEAGNHRQRVDERASCTRCTRTLSFEEQRDNGCVCFTCAEEGR